MRRLSGESAGFLSLELPIQPMNSMALAVLGTAEGAAPLDLAYLCGHMAARLGELPAFRWRVVPVPLGLHHAVFIEDPGFDLDHHLREVRLPEPGGTPELDRLVASLAEQTLDRRHPLWQLVLVSGLEGGRQAVVVRIHHCLMDGFATVATLSSIFSGEDHRPAAPAHPWHPEPVPGRSRLIRDALRDQGRAARRLPALIGKTRRNLAQVKAQRSPSVVVPKPGRDTPASAINQALTVDRRVARTSLAVADLKVVRVAAGVSVNDVALAIVAGSFRAYLLARGALPSKPLLANVPVGMEARDAPTRTFGNRFSALVTSLATDIADPWERLVAISAVTAEAKRQLTIAGPELLPDWLEYLPPAILDRLVRHGHRSRRKHPEKVDLNVVVSNVRGPSSPWSLGPAPVEELYIAGPPDNGVGANVVLWDYGERLLFAILTFADSVDAPAELTEGLHRALAELMAVARTRTGNGGTEAGVTSSAPGDGEGSTSLDRGEEGSAA